jgi:glutamyl-tRNA reductase
VALIVCGISHRTAPIEIRERGAYGVQELAEGVARLREAAEARECVVLSTCNRTEVYVVEGDTEAVPRVWSALSARMQADAAQFGYVHRDREAVRHLMRVTTGLDSMIIGEAQIHGQVRDAWEVSRAQAGPVLNRLFQSGLSVAGRVRAETGIGRGAASISSAAVTLAKKIFGPLQGRRALVLGAGEMAELALQSLLDEGVGPTFVANRSFEHAAELGRRHGATAIRYDECWAKLATVDVLVCATSAPSPVVSRQQVAPALAHRGDRPLCILDIALPRDVEPSVGALDHVFLHDLDDLRAVVSANIDRRRAELPTAEQVIDDEVERYWEWLAGLAVVPVVAEFRAAMDRLRGEELAQAVRRMGELSPAQRDTIDHFSRALMNKFLHEPSVRLRAAAANGRGLGIVDAVRYLFALGEPVADVATGRESVSEGRALRGDAPPEARE